MTVSVAFEKTATDSQRLDADQGPPGPEVDASATGYPRSQRHEKSAVYHAAAGALAGTFSTFLFHPLDVIKTRFQVQDGSVTPLYRSTSQAFRLIAAREGWRALYQGLTPSLIGASASWSIYFYSYNVAKKFLAGSGETKRELTWNLHLFAAAQAGVVVAVGTNPIWVVKTRLELQNRAASADASSAYRGLSDALARIVREEGVLALYKGLLPSLILVSHGALQFMAYEQIKKGLQRRHHVLYPDDPTGDLTTGEYLMTAASAKMFASGITYPYQVLRARMQQRLPCGSTPRFVPLTKHLFEHEGMRGFYKGMVPNALKVVPSAAVTFVAYENILRYLATSHLAPHST